MFNNKKIIIPIALLCFVIILAIAYAAFTSNLNITGTGNVRDSKWKVYFSRLSEATTTGTATVSMPTLQANATSIGDYTATVMSPGDSISFEVDVTNDGDYDALLSNVTINGTPTCKYNNDATDGSAVNVCNNLTYSIKYKGGASLIANTDILHSKETQTLVVELKYANITNSNLLPTHDIDITGLGISLTYVQSGNAKVNSDGTTPWVDPYDYHVGDKIQVAGDISGDYYYVIADSNKNDDYVVALKENYLTRDEMGDVSSSAFKNQYASDMKYGQADYSISYAKSAVDNWTTAKFTNSELKQVEGYSARLIKLDELINTFEFVLQATCATCEETWHSTSSTPSWLLMSSGFYWTMSRDGDSEMVWAVSRDDISSRKSNEDNTYSYVRPVINLKKSAIAS